MKLANLTNNAIRTRNLIDVANAANLVAKDNLELVSWISPTGDLYIEPRPVIEAIIAEGSWR